MNRGDGRDDPLDEIGGVGAHKGRKRQTGALAALCGEQPGARSRQSKTGQKKKTWNSQTLVLHPSDTIG